MDKYKSFGRCGGGGDMPVVNNKYGLWQSKDSDMKHLV